MVGLGHPESAVNRVNRELTTFPGLTVREYRTIPTRDRRWRIRSREVGKRYAVVGNRPPSRPTPALPRVGDNRQRGTTIAFSGTCLFVCVSKSRLQF